MRGTGLTVQEAARSLRISASVMAGPVPAILLLPAAQPVPAAARGWPGDPRVKPGDGHDGRGPVLIQIGSVSV